MPNGGREAAKPTAGTTVRSSPEPRGQRDGVAARGYVSARESEAVDGQELRNQKARLVAVDDGLDTGTRTGAKAADMLVSLPGQERSSARTGHPHPLPEQRPTGRANSSSGPARHDVPALNERIQAMRASGMTLQAIADSLNAENVPTLRGGTMWRPSVVRAAAGYSRPGRGASVPRDGGERDADGSFGERRERSRRSASSRGEGAIR